MDDNNRRTKVALDDHTDNWRQEQPVQRKKVDENVSQDVSAEVNMEASISSDDVIRAGGFGARDDISSFLPVASDSTDFEASLRDAREYEDPQEDIKRPGLGWTESKK